MCFKCNRTYTCVDCRKRKNNPTSHRGHELPHDMVLLTENLVMLNKQLACVTDPKKRLKLVSWIDYVESRLYQKKAAQFSYIILSYYVT